jgi:Polyketide cyclase / dehydrase and lipid transport
MVQWLALLPLLVATGTPGYKHVGGKHGVEVFRQEKSPTIDLLAEGDIEAPPARVRAVLLDYGNARVLTDHLAESRVLATKPHEFTVYQRLKLPIVSDRDYTMRAQWGERGNTLWTRFAVDNSRGPAPRKGAVRVSTLTGGWDLMPTRGGTATHAVYRVRIDMAGSIPQWMVSGGAAKDLPKLFEGIRKQVRQPTNFADAPHCGGNC